MYGTAVWTSMREAGRDQPAVHCPVHVGGERDAVARVVVAGLGEGVEVRGLAPSPCKDRSQNPRCPP